MRPSRPATSPGVIELTGEELASDDDLGMEEAVLHLFQPLLRFQAHLNLLRNGFPQLSLDLQKISNFAIKTLRPNMRLVPDADELCTYPGASALATHAALHDVVHSQFLPDLPCRFVCVPIRHR